MLLIGVACASITKYEYDVALAATAGVSRISRAAFYFVNI